jgi:hypothetical protein
MHGREEMKTIGISRDEAIKQIAAVERALEEGHPPPPGDGRNKGALSVAADRLGISINTLRNRTGAPGAPGILKRIFDLVVDWDKYKPRLSPPSGSKASQIRSSDDLRYTLLLDEVRDLRDQLRAAHRASGTEEIIRQIVGRIADTPREPPKWATEPPKRERHKSTPEVPVTIWSDWHLGEVVERAEVNGFNSFNLEIAEIRIERLIDTTIRLCRENHTGTYPGIVVNMLGDFVSGGLHPELLATDEEEVIPCSLKAADWLVGGLRRIADHFGRVYVPCATGNHGRTTTKPEFKRYYRKNFDWLIIQMVARHFAEDKRIQFDIRPSNDVHYRVFGERYLACHGDMLGVRGGDGIIGSIGPIVRGEIKQAGQSQALGFGFDKLLCGHWHQRLWLPRAIVNNALKGFDEYAMKALGAKPDRPTQALWFVHPAHGQTAHWDVYLDDKPAPVSGWISWKEKA